MGVVVIFQEIEDIHTQKREHFINKMGLKKLLTEAFEGMGGIVTLKPLNNNQGCRTSQKQKVNETIPAAAREWKNLEKAEQVYTKAVLDLGKVVGKQDQKAGREVVGLYRTLSASMKKFKELLSREVLDKIQ